MILTKIVATMGPACDSVDTLHRLIEGGMDVCRINFSHGTLDGHLLTLRNIREAVARSDRPIAVLGDLCGPKIRLGRIADHDGTGGLPVATGDEIVIQRTPVEGHRDEQGLVRVSSNYRSLVDDVAVGDRVLVEDGLLRFVCTDKNFNELRLACTVGGVLKSAKGINLPNSAVSVPSITERDWECVEWAIDNELDYLALSFVRRADDLLHLREHLRNRGSDISLIAKIEKKEAVENIDPILEASDGLMIARGDLGVELDLADVPLIQKELIRKGQAAGKPVIVATQMLQSMIENASPTRAEVSDIANAIFDGTDAVMLSGETSIGKFPLGAVGVMAHICQSTERYIITRQTPVFPRLSLKTLQLSSAVARGVWQIVQDLKVKLVVIWSQTGTSARVFAKNRYPVPILALSSDHRALRRMALMYGVLPVEMEPPTSMTHLVQAVDAIARQRKLAALGDRVVIVAGAALGTPATLNGIVIHTLGEDVGRSPPVEPLPNAVAADDLPPIAGVAYTGAPVDAF
ncbi:MAG: pyruvate kinase [Tepidisphaerales bacterium]